jgi:hypothetical protein
MNSEIDVVVTGPGGDEIKAAAQDCLTQGAIKSALAAMIAGYASGGTAAVTAAVTTFAQTVDSCVEGKLAKELNISAEVRNSSHWDEDYS